MPASSMKVVAGGNERGSVAASVFVLGALAVMAVAVVTNGKPQIVGPVAAALAVFAVTWRRVLAWRSLLAITIFLIMFVPIKRYDVPASLPFQLEPYRIFIAFAALGWIASLLVDPRVRLRRSGIEAPLLLFAVAIVASLLANPSRVASVSTQVNKTLVFFLSFFVVFYMTVSCIRRVRDIDFVVKWLVGCGAVLAIFAIVERRTNYNFFNHLASWLPLRLNKEGVPDLDLRGGRLRVVASAQHPIALGAAFAMLVPLGIYTAKTTGKARWTIATVLITLAMFSTGSRTAVLMILVIAIVFAWLRWREMKRLWPALLPMVVVLHVAAPGALGTIKESFFPKGGLIAQQQDAPEGHARLSTLGPTLHREVYPHPAFGLGFATRVTMETVEPDGTIIPGNARILDDQWLGVLAETGLIGFGAFGWMFIRFVRRAGRDAKHDRSQRGWLLTATVASVAGYGAGMFTYDAFSFIQVTLLLFLVLGLGCAAWKATPEPADEVPVGPTRRPRAPRPPRRPEGPRRRVPAPGYARSGV